MNPAQLLNSLSDSDKSTVIRHALPGIDSFLNEILSSANLSQEAEKLRLQYLGILEYEGAEEAKTAEKNAHETNGKTSEAIAVAGKELSLSDDSISKVINRLDADENAESWNSGGHASKVTISPKVHRKGTGETKENGISLQAEPWLHSHSPVDTHIPSSITSTQGETILPDITADLEVVDWESDATNGNEEGYCTGDNMCLESSIQNFNICPNELGELYTGVLYIQEHPGWHKRWFTLNDHCLKCFRHRTESKMLFEIPLKGARIISTDRKKSRVFPIVLSIPKIKESIMFAATEEHVRQKWKYVLSYVIRQLGDRHSSGDIPGTAESKISLHSLLGGKSVYGNLDEEQKSLCLNEQQEECSGLMLHVAEEGKQQNEAVKVSESSEEPETVKNWTNPSPKESLVQWQVNIEAEDELMEPSFAAAMAEDESFRELQECLPEILQGRKSRIPSKNNSVKRVLSTGDLPGSAVCPSSPSWGSILSTSSSEGTTVSTSDLYSTTKVKRQTSLANSISSKASRVKSRITGSFFKKGKKEEEKAVKIYTSKSTTFSGYLLRMKGSLWKSRWCVVKEHSLFCYKDFDVGAAELGIRLPGSGIECVPESDSKKPFAFVISTEKEDYHFAAENDAELEEWIMVLRDEIKLAEQTVSTTVSPASSTSAIPEVEEETYTDSPARGRKLAPTWKKDKSVLSGKKSILSSIGHKFGKTKTKVSQSGEASNDVINSSSAVDVEDEFVAAQPREITSDDIPALVERPPLPQLANNLEVPSAHMSGFLHQRVQSDTWLKCWVKLENHFLYIHDDKDRGDAVVIKFKLSNCVVLDCTVEDRTHVMEIRRSRSQPIYLQAESREEYDQWKATISESIIESPLPARRTRPLPAQSSLDDCQISPRLRLKIGGDSFEQEDVFKPDGQAEDTRLDLPLNPSPRPSTAGDVSSVESEDDGTPLDTNKRNQCEEEPARLRSFSEGEQDEERTRNNKSQINLRRSLSNALSSLDVTSTKKRRNKTLSGIKVPPELLMNITHTSCLYLRNKSGLWSKRWAILQEDKLHLFKRADDISPSVCITVEGCEVRQTTRKKTKKFAFELSIPSESAEYCLAADNHKELVTWMDLLQANPRDKGKVSQGGFPQEANRPKTSPVEPKELQHSEVPQPKDATVNTGNTKEPRVELSGSTGNGLTGSEITGSVITGSEMTDVSCPESVAASEKSGCEGLQPSSPYEKPSSLEAVLRLLQDQQLVQQIGQQRFEKAKKVQSAWKRSAAAAREAAKDQNSRPDSPDGHSEKCEPMRRSGSSASETRYRTRSLKETGASPKQSCVDVTEKFEKLADEEKLRALRKETLLKKRRNSLNLEKDVLERKIVKGQEKKSTMKRLLGKDETDNKEDLAPAEKRLGDVQHELESVQRDIEQNRRQKTEVLENLNNLKTKTVRKFSFRGESNPAGSARAEGKRKAFRSSPSESASSQGSVEERPGRELDSLPKTPDPSRKKSGVETLAALEQELMKISPLSRRAPDVRKKRVSLSSEGTASPDDASVKGSPTPAKKSDAHLTEPVGTSDSSTAGSPGRKSPVSEALLDCTELRRKRFSASSRVSFHKLSVEIPTDDGLQQQEAVNTVKTTAVIAETGSETNGKQKDHKTSFVNALSQIKDFEEFAAGSLTEKHGQPKVL